eukprot:scaffold4457_cov142-Skeletonema_marinoi.AAC.2
MSANQVARPDWSPRPRGDPSTSNDTCRRMRLLEAILSLSTQSISSTTEFILSHLAHGASHPL